jgi:predicted transcriptional regulator
MSGRVEVPLTARVSVEDRDAMKELADKADRTRSAEVRRAIRQYIERERKAA